MADRIPRPEWHTRPPEEWPESARAFYRLCWVISQRVASKRLLQGSPGSPLIPDVEQNRK
jgi:hypothetical protein